MGDEAPKAARARSRVSEGVSPPALEEGHEEGLCPLCGRRSIFDLKYRSILVQTWCFLHNATIHLKLV